MRRGFAFGIVFLATGAAAGACSGSSNSSGFATDGGGSGSSSGSGGSGSGSGSGGSGSGSSSGVNLQTNDGGNNNEDGGTIVTTKTTIYAHTDSALYTLLPGTTAATDAVTLIGPFDTIDAGKDAVTDLAVNAAGDIYVCTHSTIYSVVLPAGGTGTVHLANATPLVFPGNLTAAEVPYMYALAFAPPGLLGGGTVETLVGGDGNGEIWSIDPSTGAAKDLGNFGTDPAGASGAFFGLSGDIVFYLDSTGAATGLATIRSCTPNTQYPTDGPYCTAPSDYLAGINITELTNAYTSGTPSLSLNGGIYGAPAGMSTTEDGPGTGFRDLFGLGAWEGNVYAFSRYLDGKDGGAATPPQLISISTTTGAGTVIPETFDFTEDGWSGAGVTTKVTVTVIAPPPPPPIK